MGLMSSNLICSTKNTFPRITFRPRLPCITNDRGGEESRGFVNGREPEAGPRMKKSNAEERAPNNATSEPSRDGNFVFACETRPFTQKVHNNLLSSFRSRTPREPRRPVTQR